MSRGEPTHQARMRTHPPLFSAWSTLAAWTRYGIKFCPIVVGTEERITKAQRRPVYSIPGFQLSRTLDVQLVQLGATFPPGCQPWLLRRIFGPHLCAFVGLAWQLAGSACGAIMAFTGCGSEVVSAGNGAIAIFKLREIHTQTTPSYAPRNLNSKFVFPFTFFRNMRNLDHLATVPKVPPDSLIKQLHT